MKTKSDEDFEQLVQEKGSLLEKQLRSIAKEKLAGAAMNCAVALSFTTVERMRYGLGVHCEVWLEYSSTKEGERCIIKPKYKGEAVRVHQVKADILNSMSLMEIFRICSERATGDLTPFI